MFILPNKGVKKNLLSRFNLENIHEKKIIITFSTGRSGTNFFESLFDIFSDEIDSFHEGKPSLSSVLRNSCKNYQSGMKFMLEEKIPSILSYKKEYYSETSHLYCKSFITQIIDLGIEPYTIFISRHPSEVANSFYKIGSIPERTKLGQDFMLTPYEPNLVQLKNIEKLSDYQLCFWYAIEIEMRARLFIDYYKLHNIPFYEFNFEEIGNENEILKILDWLQLDHTKHKNEIKRLLGIKVNNKNNLKSKLSVNEVNYKDEELALLEQISFGKKDVESYFSLRFGGI